ncbi:MAG TPA: sensor histidine kinase, partial [Pilimelia sp.]|nr:sensor histidine kinase [Pilimelia sp.]
MADADLRPLLSRRLRAGELIALDVGAAALWTLFCAEAARANPAGALPEPMRVSWLAGAAIGLPAAVRRPWPLPALAAVLAASATALATGVIPTYAAPAPLMVLGYVIYAVALAEPARRSVPALVTGLCMVVVILVADDAQAQNRWSDAILGAAACAILIGGAWALGRAVRARREYAARSVRQAADAAREMARHAVTEERVRIARELHDIAAHSMSLIAVKASIANHVAEARPQEARDALRIIESTSREALADLRRALGIMRSDTEPAADLEPAPGLADLPRLADRAAMAGVAVDLALTGPVERVPEGVALSAYRIVQEAVTNVVRHAGVPRCRAVVRVEPGEVRIAVTDDGVGGRAQPGHGVERPGHGLIGMRERALLYGGACTAG